MKKTIIIAATLMFVLALHAQTTFNGKPMYNVMVKRAGVPIGSFTVELFPNIAPKHTRNFDSLVSTGFYDTTAFHRVIPNFMIQGGDPNSRSGPVSTWGYGQASQPKVNAEFSTTKHVRGILSAARSNNINSATSQFFICVAPASHLNGQYSAYGRVLKGMNVVDTIVLAPRNAQDRPNQKHEMFITYLASNDTTPNAPQQTFPKNDSLDVDTSYVQLKWNPVSDGIIYHLDVSNDSTFTSTVLSTDISNLNANFSGMSGNTWYYWRLRTNNGGHFSAYSPTWKFHTAGQTTGIPKQTLAPLHISVSPNPSDGNFIFRGFIPASNLFVFDHTGRLVYQSAVNENTISVNLKEKSKGIYFYSVNMGGIKTITGRLFVK